MQTYKVRVRMSAYLYFFITQRINRALVTGLASSVIIVLPKK